MPNPEKFNPDLPEIQERLNKYLDPDGFSEPEKKFEEMQRLCEYFKHPEKAYPTIHVAGSKGKGSTSAYLSSILNEAGYKVGKLSSPYVIHFGERFMCDREYFADFECKQAMDELEKGLQKLQIQKLPHSILMTLYAFLLFRVAKCDFAVIEVGIGGRLDPTNVVTPEICVITTLELEHQQILGSTLAEIAGEKAGIIKPGVPVVIAKQRPEAMKVLEKVASERKAELIKVDAKKATQEFSYFFDDSFDESVGRLMLRADVKTDDFPDGLRLNLKMCGEFQIENALLAATAIAKMQLGIKCETIERGVQRVELPGRFNMLRHPLGFDKIPYLVIDGAHTVNSVRGSLAAFREIRRLESIQNAQDSCLTDFCPGAEPLLLFSAASDKAVEEMAKELKTEFKNIILTTLEYKEVDLDRLLRAFVGKNDGTGAFADDEENLAIWKNLAIIADPEMVAETALSMADRERRPLVVIGSMYLAGMVYRELEKRWEKIKVFN